LTDDELKFLAEREQLVSAGVKASICAAKALHEIRSYMDGKLWKSSHGTFEAYCEAKWGYARASAYNLAASGEILVEIEAAAAKSLSANADFAPLSESHLRPLKKVPEAKRAECWLSIVAKTPPTELTESYVKAEAAKFAEEIGVGLTTPKGPPPTVNATAAKFLVKLRAAVESLPASAQINALLTQIETLLA